MSGPFSLWRTQSNVKELEKSLVFSMKTDMAVSEVLKLKYAIISNVDMLHAVNTARLITESSQYETVNLISSAAR